MGRPAGWRLAVPGIGFLAYVAYLALWSPDPFLTRWIEGCFAFFLALVLAYIIVRNARGEEADPEGPVDPDGPPPGDPGG